LSWGGEESLAETHATWAWVAISLSGGAVSRVSLAAQCVAPQTTGGRTVTKSDYEAQYQATQERAQTLEYRAVRREHPRIERKLAELVRWHAARRVRYRGRLRVKIQYLLTAVVVNCKRIVTLLSLAGQPQFA